jgi:hypothetical protein
MEPGADGVQRLFSFEEVPANASTNEIENRLGHHASRETRGGIYVCDHMTVRELDGS